MTLLKDVDNLIDDLKNKSRNDELRKELEKNIQN